MSYKKPTVAKLNLSEKPAMATGKKECAEMGCCVKSLKHY